MFTIIGTEPEHCPVPQEIQQFVQASGSIEELVFEALNRRYQLRVGAFGLATEGIMCVRIENSPFSLRKDDTQVWLKADIAEIQERYSWQPLNETLHDFADKDGYVVDVDWFEKRDRKLRVREDPWEGEIIAPASALAPLILSYALSASGWASVSREIIELKSPAVCDAAKIDLAYVNPKTEKGFGETICIRLDLIEKRASSARTRSGRGSGQAVVEA